MHHLAILNKSRKLLDKILSGQKTIESRRYKTRRDSLNNIQSWDTVFFKNSGELVQIKATVSKVLQFSNLSESQRADLVSIYGGPGKICFTSSSQDVVARTQGKKYCILVFLSNPQSITPFDIDKTWFGISSARICIDDIEKIKK